MANETERRILKKMEQHIDRGELAAIALTARQGGGVVSPHKRETVLSLSLGRGARLRRSLAGAVDRRGEAAVDADEMKSLLAEIQNGISSLIPRSKARFAPDSALGSITLEIDGETADFFYLLDPKIREKYGQTLSPAMEQALQRLSRISERMPTHD